MEKGSSINWYLMFGLVVVLSFSTRFYKVLEPDHVCWDETHFGKMGSWYINRTFFFDVHPPLGKMLIALSGYLTGYDGSFPFDKPGDKYEDTNYHGMRLFCSFLGGCIGPLAYVIVWELTFSLSASFLSSMLIICDVGVLTLTQYILLDPILLFFIMSSIYGVVKFNNCFDLAFQVKWWFWLCFTGAMLACALSVKFVGLFVVLYVGLHTIDSLWTILADLSHPISYTVRHFFARFIGLIVLPTICYVFFFYIHLRVLHKSGMGDGFFSSAFQSQLRGNSLYNASMPREVAYGAVVTLKNRRTGGGYLHSHWHLYPDGVGARQQQVTTYTHKDENNRWLVKPYDDELEIDEEIEYLRHGDLIRLEHLPTKRNLHAHKEQAPVTKKHLQVTGYGENGTGDPNDIWKVQILNGKEGDIVTTVTSKLKLVHYLQHCVLTTTGKQLPAWAYEQQEVTCNPNLRDSYAVWNVEDNIFPKLPNVSFEVYASNFFERFLESHAVMLQGNSGLKPKEGEVTSRPWQWPINYRGQFFSGSNYRIYLLGNPVIWWGNLAFLVIFLTVYGISAVIQKRGSEFGFFKTDVHWRFMNACKWLFIGYALHYIPFYAMGRVLYFHHYFPALLYSSMLSGVIFTYFLEAIKHLINEKLSSSIYHWLFGGALSTVIYSFYLFSPLAYGMSGPYAQDPKSSMFGLKWVDTWEF